MKRLVLLIAVVLLISLNLFAQSHSVYVELFKSNGIDHPAAGDVTFDCYITARPAEIKTQADFGFDYNESYAGFIQCNVGNFSSPWSAGEYLHINALEISTGDTDSKEFLLTDAGYDYFAGNEDGMVLTGEPPLSITLSSFTATYSTEALNICWITQSESNNAGWNVYRSDNECLEEAIQVNSELIAGAGTTSEPTEYTFADEHPVETETTYHYWLESRDFDGLTETHGPVSLIIPQPEENDPDDQDNEKIGLFQNYPNPFSASTIIAFSITIEDKENSMIVIYNMKGQKVREYSIVNDQSSIVWDGRDNNDNAVSSGIYFYKLEAGDKTCLKKLILLR